MFGVEPEHSKPEPFAASMHRSCTKRILMYEVSSRKFSGSEQALADRVSL